MMNEQGCQIAQIIELSYYFLIFVYYIGQDDLNIAIIGKL